MSRSAVVMSMTSEPPPSISLRSSTLPEVGSISRNTHRAVVDFPHPDSPTSPRVVPRGMSKETPETADTTPLGPLEKMPPPTSKFFTRLRTEIAESVPIWRVVESVEIMSGCIKGSPKRM